MLSHHLHFTFPYFQNVINVSEVKAKKNMKLVTSRKTSNHSCGRIKAAGKRGEIRNRLQAREIMQMAGKARKPDHDWSSGLYLIG